MLYPSLVYDYKLPQNSHRIHLKTGRLSFDMVMEESQDPAIISWNFYRSILSITLHLYRPAFSIVDTTCLSSYSLSLPYTHRSSFNMIHIETTHLAAYINHFFNNLIETIVLWGTYKALLWHPATTTYLFVTNDGNVTETEVPVMTATFAPVIWGPGTTESVSFVH